MRRLATVALLARRLGGSARSATWVALPVLVAFWRVAVVMRPQTFAFPLFAVVLWLLLDAGARERVRLWARWPAWAVRWVVWRARKEVRRAADRRRRGGERHG